MIDLILLKLADKEEKHTILDSNFGRIGQQTTELAALEHPKNTPLGYNRENSVYIFSSPEPKAVVVHRSQCSKIFSETALPIKAKFYVEPPWVGGTKLVM